MPKVLKRKDEVGNKYTRLTVLEYAGNSTRGLAKWKCRCDCGNEIIVFGSRLRNGWTKSCGCLGDEHISKLKALTEQEKIDRATKPRICSGCNETKPPSAFSAIVRRRCNSCDNKRLKEWMGPDYRFKVIKDAYGITKEEYMSMLDAQDGTCKICHKSQANSKTPLHVDHDHDRKKGDAGYVRGLLCSTCNMGLGNLKDDPEIVMSAYHYLVASKNI